MQPLMNQFKQATEFLAQQDSDWAWLIATVGECSFSAKSEREPYEALTRAVAYQQLSTKVGDKLIDKLVSRFGHFPLPHELVAADFESLRAIGFSVRKIDTLKAIASGVLSGLVPSREVANHMSNEALIARLVSIKGIGQWTVEMMLIFTLGRLDILPVDDFGILAGYMRLKKLDALPKRKEMMRIAQAWSPCRTIASWYLWRVPKELESIKS